jgi:hypothetical protein
MNRLVLGCVAAFAVLIGFLWSGWPPEPAAAWAGAGRAPADRLQANTVWQGTCVQSKPKDSYPMVLFIKQRRGNTFEAVSWYPTLENGLITVTGKVGPQRGTVTFSENAVIHGEATADRAGVVAGSKYTAKVEGASLRGTGTWSDPRSGQGGTLRFSLRLAQ